MSEKNVHSVRFRVKDAKGLIAKIIRKRIDDPKRIIDLKNFRTEVTDLIGVRAIHFATDFKAIAEKMTREQKIVVSPDISQ